jgi:LEA14-like dessication related protein
MRSNRALSGIAGSTRTSEIRIVKRLVPLLLLPALLLCAPSCRPLIKQVFKNPKVRVASVALSGNPFLPSKEPLEAVLHLSVQNPNSYALSVSQAAYTVTVGRQTLASGEKPEQVRIEPSAETLVKVPVALDTNAFSAALRDVIEGRAIPYEFNGSLAVDAPIVGLVRVPFSKAGTLDPMDILRKKGIRFN